MISTDDKGLNETEDTTLRVPEMTAEEAQDANLALPGVLLVSPATQDLHQEATSTSMPLSAPPAPQASPMPEEAARKRNGKRSKLLATRFLSKISVLQMEMAKESIGGPVGASTSTLPEATFMKVAKVRSR